MFFATRTAPGLTDRKITVQPQSTSASYVHKHDNASDSDDDTIEPVSFRGLTRSEMLNTRKRLRWTPEDRKTMSRFAVKQAIVSQNRNRDLDRQVREILVPAIFEGERDWEQHKKSAKVLAELTQRTANALTYHMQRNLRAVPMVDGKMVWPEWTKSWLDESWDGDVSQRSDMWPAGECTKTNSCRRLHQARRSRLRRKKEEVAIRSVQRWQRSSWPSVKSISTSSGENLNNALQVSGYHTCAILFSTNELIFQQSTL